MTLVNILLLAVNLILMVVYRLRGGLLLKGITSSGFAVLGILNLCSLQHRGKNTTFAKWLAAALVLSVAADVALNVEFLVGAVLFALGHVLYGAAYCALDTFRKQDVIPIAAMAAVSLLVVNSPVFRSGDSLMTVLVNVYALVISFMTGKAISNFLKKRGTVRGLLASGSLLFWFSDLMLAWELFAGGGYLADTLCLFTYFPGQSILAHSLYHYSKER